MIRDILFIMLCLWLAVRLRRRSAGGQGPDPWELAGRSLRLGTLIVTGATLGFLGVMRFKTGEGIPSALSVILCTGLTSLVMMGSPPELTGNVVVDGVALSALIVAASFAVLNGVPAALALASGPSVSLWLLACIGAGIAVRAVIWAIEGR
jgi:hypothetical protein